MNKNIIIEALDFAIRSSEINIMVNGKTNETINQYGMYKVAYKSLRIHNHYMKEVCISAIYLFVTHLKSELKTYTDISEFVLQKINSLKTQYNLLKNSL